MKNILEAQTSGPFYAALNAVKARISRVEDDILRLQGGRIRPGASNVSGAGSSGSSGSSGGLSSADVISLVSRMLIFQEDISSAGTSHSTTYDVALDASGDPIALVFLNGVQCRRGASGQNGWSFTDPATITTIKSLTANDKLTIAYAKRNP